MTRRSKQLVVKLQYVQLDVLSFRITFNENANKNAKHMLAIRFRVIYIPTYIYHQPNFYLIYILTRFLVLVCDEYTKVENLFSLCCLELSLFYYLIYLLGWY